MNSNSLSSGDTLILTSVVLTIVFVLFRLIGITNWDWVWIVSPLWIIVLLSVVCELINIVVAFVSRMR